MSSLSNHPYGYPLTILAFEEPETEDNDEKLSGFKENLSSLEEILSHKDVSNRKIAVISIVGAFRKGKSFLLDFILRYLYGTYPSISVPKNKFTPNTNWIGQDEEPLTGFSWKKGLKRDTTGMIVWSDVFLYDAPNKEKIAILLIDTQGLFDGELTSNENNQIFTLSCLFSSMQIMNLSENIQENDLQYLQFAVEFANAAKNCLRETASPFQNFIFLIRDWSSPKEYEYGFDGGNRFLDKVLEVKDDQKDEIKNIRLNLKSAFEKTLCCLMPFPGTKVARGKNISGCLSHVDEEFKELLLNIVPRIASSENLSCKRVGIDHITAKEYLLYIQTYIKAVKSKDMPIIHSMHIENIINQCSKSVQACIKKYEESFSCFNILKISNIEEFEALNAEKMKEALQLYDSNFRYRDSQQSNDGKNTLLNTLNQIYEKNKYFCEKSLKSKEFLKKTLVVVGSALFGIGAIALAFLFRIKG